MAAKREGTKREGAEREGAEREGNAKKHVFIVAAEKSGDELGAALAQDLRAQTNGQIRLSAVGGSALAREGLTSPVDISPLAILGLVEGVKVYPIIMDRVYQTVDLILQSGADAAVLIDSWGFMMRVAKRLRKKKYQGKIIKYVAPQVWATREGRSKILAAHVDALLTIHNFDAPYFTRHGLKTIAVGNPVFDKDYTCGDGQGLRNAYNIPQNAPVVCVLFGSRLSEIQRLAKPFAQAVAQIKRKTPDVHFVSPVSDTISEDVLAAVMEYPALQDVIMLSEAQKLDCFAAANVALACSGTVTSQLASAGIPTIVGYKLSGLSYQIARHLFKPDYVSIVNIAAGAELMPEFIQSACTGEKLANALIAYLQDTDACETARRALLAQTADMRADKSETSSSRAAKAVLELIASPPL